MFGTIYCLAVLCLHVCSITYKFDTIPVFGINGVCGRTLTDTSTANIHRLQIQCLSQCNVASR